MEMSSKNVEKSALDREDVLCKVVQQSDTQDGMQKNGWKNVPMLATRWAYAKKLRVPAYVPYIYFPKARERGAPESQGALLGRPKGGLRLRPPSSAHVVEGLCRGDTGCPSMEDGGQLQWSFPDGLSACWQGSHLLI